MKNIQISRKQKNYYKKVVTTQFEINWNCRYFELKDFIKKFGHSNVPQKWPENKSLGRWVIRQRVYKQRLTPDRIEKLDLVGFAWNTFDLAWENKFRELLLFKEKFGHCHVSKADINYLPLADWVVKQRRDRKKNYLRLAAHKIERLNAIGFYWGRTKPGWEKQFEQLVRFYKANGHCKVPQHKGTNETLANWVSIQRSKKNQLTKEQIERLNSLEFIWSIKPRKIRTKL